MSIEMPAAEVHALANALRTSAGTAGDVGGRLDRAGDLGSTLRPAVEAFLENHRTAGRALAGELEWLSSTVAAVADSWVHLDRVLLASSGSQRAE
jgi:hypothetical protein